MDDEPTINYDQFVDVTEYELERGDVTPTINFSCMKCNTMAGITLPQHTLLTGPNPVTQQCNKCGNSITTVIFRTTAPTNAYLPEAASASAPKGTTLQ